MAARPKSTAVSSLCRLGSPLQSASCDPSEMVLTSGPSTFVGHFGDALWTGWKAGATDLSITTDRSAVFLGKAGAWEPWPVTHAVGLKVALFR